MFSPSCAYLSCHRPSLQIGFMITNKQQSQSHCSAIKIHAADKKKALSEDHVFCKEVNDIHLVF